MFTNEFDPYFFLQIIGIDSSFSDMFILPNGSLCYSEIFFLAKWLSL